MGEQLGLFAPNLGELALVVMPDWSAWPTTVTEVGPDGRVLEVERPDGVRLEKWRSIRLISDLTPEISSVFGLTPTGGFRDCADAMAVIWPLAATVLPEAREDLLVVFARGPRMGNPRLWVHRHTVMPADWEPDREIPDLERVQLAWPFLDFVLLGDCGDLARCTMLAVGSALPMDQVAGPLAEVILSATVVDLSRLDHPSPRPRPGFGGIPAQGEPCNCFWTACLYSEELCPSRLGWAVSSIAVGRGRWAPVPAMILKHRSPGALLVVSHRWWPVLTARGWDRHPISPGRFDSGDDSCGEDEET